MYVIEIEIAHAVLIDGYTQDSGTRRAPVEDPSGVIHHHSHVRGMLHETAKPLLACSYCGLGRLSVGDIAADTDDTDNATSAVSIRSLHRHIGPHRAVWTLYRSF